MVGIISNSAALIAQSNLNRASIASEASIARLSSGNAIVSAADDVSGLAIGTVLQSDVNALKTVFKSTAQAKALLQLADGGLQNIGDILQRQKALAVQANSGTLSNNERAFLNQEFSNLTLEIDRIVTSTQFNGIALLDGSVASNSSITYSDPDATGDFLVAGTQGTTYLTATAITVTTGVDPSLIGAGTEIEVQGLYTATNSATFYLTINGQTYVTAAEDISGASTTVEFNNADTGARITVELANQTTVSESQANIDTIAAGIEADLATITFYQQREFSSSATTGLPATAFANTILEGLANTDFELRSQHFNTADDTGPAVTAFRVTAETATTDGQIAVTIGGETFQTAAGAFNSNTTNIKAIGNVTLTNVSDSNERFQLDFTNLLSTSVGVDTDASAQLLEDALNTLFGVGTTGGLDFQVGVDVTDTISLTLNSAATSTIYVDDDGVVQTISVDTSTNAQLANEVLDQAITTVTSLRATVGALTSRFDFAGKVVQTAIENTEAARSQFLDTDIASESTAFATAQVRLQASISVLAQANQLPQNLLKLIG